MTIGALPVVAAVEHHEDAAGVEAAERSASRIARPARQAHPQHVDRRAEVAAPRSPACSRTVEWRPSAPTTRSARISSGPSRRRRAHADDAAVLVDQVGRPRVSISRWNAGIARAPRSARKSRKSHCGISAMNLQRVGRCEKSAMRDRARRRSGLRAAAPPGAAASGTRRAGRARASPRSVEGWIVSPRKSRRKSPCFSSTDDIDAGARQQKAQHHPGRPAADDAAAGGEHCGRRCRSGLVHLPGSFGYASSI